MALQKDFNSNFSIHTEKANPLQLIITPAGKTEFEPVTIPVTQEQWDALRFGFITAESKEGTYVCYL